MANATVQLRKLTGAGPAATVVTTTRVVELLSADQDDDITTEFVVPADPARSYWSVLRPNVSANPDSQTISDLMVWFEHGDGQAAGVDIVVGIATAYTQATGDDVLNDTNYPSLEDLGGGVYTVNIDEVTDSGAALTVSGSTSGTGEDSFDYIVLQLQWTAGSQIGPTELVTIHLDFTRS